MIALRLAAVSVIAAASFIFAAIAGISGADDNRLAYAVVAMVCIAVSLGLMLDRERKPSPRPVVGKRRTRRPH